MKNDLKDFKLGFKGMDVVVTFFCKCLKLNNIRIKLAFLFNQKLRKEASSTPFSYGIFKLILNLTLPIVQKENLFSKIDFSFTDTLNGILPELNTNYFSIHKDSDEIVKNRMQAKIYGTSTQFFFYCFEIIQVFLV